MTDSAMASSIVQDPHYPALKDYVVESTGLAYYMNRDSDLAFRIADRLTQLSLRGCGDYLGLLKDRAAGEPERRQLIGQLTIGETYFFRHAEQFDALRAIVFPDLIRRNRDRRTLRIWSAGCATGAEPYSLAILLKRDFGAELAGWTVQIVGTDINQDFLSRAERGSFDERALRSTPEDLRTEWFAPSGRSWIVNPDVREWVAFQHHNLVEHPYPSMAHGCEALDLILCRNVMIYFAQDVIGRILGRFHACLADAGWLAVGHAESNTEAFGGFRTVNAPGATLYQKAGPRSEIGFESVSASTLPSSLESVRPVQAWAPPDLPLVPQIPLRDAEPASALPASPGVSRIRLLADQGRWEEAVDECEVWLGRDRLNAALHFHQALVMEQLQRYGEAERALRRALYVDRTFVLAHYHLALLLRKTGDHGRAIQSFRNAQALLAAMDGRQAIADADGMTAAELDELTGMHLGLLQK